MPLLSLSTCSFALKDEASHYVWTVLFTTCEPDLSDYQSVHLFQALRCAIPFLEFRPSAESASLVSAAPRSYQTWFCRRGLQLRLTASPPFWLADRAACWRYLASGWLRRDGLAIERDYSTGLWWMVRTTLYRKDHMSILPASLNPITPSLPWLFRQKPMRFSQLHPSSSSLIAFCLPYVKQMTPLESPSASAEPQS